MRKLICIIAVFVLTAFINKSDYHNDDLYRKKLSGTYICTSFVDNDSLQARIALSAKGMYSEHWQFKRDTLSNGTNEFGKWYLEKGTLVLYHKEIVEVVLVGGKHENTELIDTAKYTLNNDSLGFYREGKKFRRINE
ncbi:MAG: hypothetical protein ACXVDZ_02785 [Bacteroidia bacterium]